MAAKPPDLDSLLECPICLSECKDPRVLPCLHTLCLKCLDQHIRTSAEGSSFLCPSCRHKCEVPAGGVTSIPQNFFLNSMREILQQQGSWKKAPPSQDCSLQREELECSNSNRGEASCGTATTFCVECAEFYCSNCKPYHLKFKKCSARQLVPVSSADTSVIKAAVLRRTTPRCDQHSTLPTDMYCNTCRVPVCMKCCLLEHKLHDYHEIEKAAEKSRSLLSTLTEIAKNIASRQDTNMQELNESEKTINTDCDEACRQVHENAEEIRALVTQREKSAVQEIRQAQTTSLTQLKASYKEAEINKAAVLSLLAYIQALLVSEDVTSQVVHAPGLKEQLRRHEVAPQQPVTLKVNLEKKIQSLSALNAMISAVSVHQTTATSVSQEGAVPKKMKVPLGSPLLDLKPDVGGDVSGLVIMGDCVCVTGYCQPYLQIHNIKTNNHKRHRLDGLSAAGMTLVHGDTLVISDRNKELHLIKIDQEMNITYHDVKNISFTPEGISVDSMRDKLIIANDTDKTIAICDTRGNIESQVKVKTSFSGFRCALATCDGYVLLDSFTEGLYRSSCFDISSRSSKLYWLNNLGVMQTYDQKLSYRNDIVQDSQGRVIIADRNHHQLHLVDVNKEFSHYLLTEKDGMRDPTCVYLDEVNARLCVACSYKTVRKATSLYESTSYTFVPKVNVYKWPFVSSSSPSSQSPGERTPLAHHKLRVELVKYQ